MRRKEFLRLAGFAGAVSALGGLGWMANGCRTKSEGSPIQPPPSDTSTSGRAEGDFRTALAIPPVMAVTSRPSFQSNIARVALIQGKAGEVYGYGGGILGPTFTAKSGEKATFAFTNRLREPTNVHWHGLIIPPLMDGHPEQSIPAAGTFNFQFDINQRAGLYWYHPHAMGSTAVQVFKGLGGLFMVTDEEEDALKLPSGDRQIPLVLQDKRFGSDGSLHYAPTKDEVMTGYFGESVLVNGVVSPFVPVATGWYRLRVLNGSTARIYNLTLSAGAEMTLVGSDAGLLARPEKIRRLLLSPGERADILVDFSTVGIGTDVFLMSDPFDGAGSQGKSGFKILRFYVDRKVTDPFTLPSNLSTIAPANPSSATRTRIFEIGTQGGGMENMKGMRMKGDSPGNGMAEMHTINGKSYDLKRIDEVLKAGVTERWVFDNSQGDEPHPMHIHGVHFRILERVGGRNGVQAGETGWKDTVLLLPKEKVSVLFQTPTFPGKYVMHCHNLEHEDSGMMMNFEVR